MDFEQEISKALSDPDIMSKVQGVLSSLNDKEESPEKGSAAEKTMPVVPSNLLSSLSSVAEDDRSRLLMAIKPFLSERRAPYMDSALTILKFASLGKLGKDMKLF